jgi:protein phosphatase
MLRAKMECAGLTDLGRVRASNQDHYLIANLKKSMLVESTSLPLVAQSRLYGGSLGRLLMVADGMGGHAAGERASTLAIDTLVEKLLNSVHWFFNLDRDAEDDFIDDLQQLLRAAHLRIVRAGERDLERRGMGTTLTMAYVNWPRLYVVHAGDSRCYLIRRGDVEQLTTDHTLARQLVEAGGLRPEEAQRSRWSNVLWNVLGGHRDELTAEVRRADLVPGDAILLCSDGLYRHVDEQEMAACLGRDCDVAEMCRDLVNLANERGGEDNVTVVVAQFGFENRDPDEAVVGSEVPLRQMLDLPEGSDEFSAAETMPGDG